LFCIVTTKLLSKYVDGFGLGGRITSMRSRNGNCSSAIARKSSRGVGVELRTSLKPSEDVLVTPCSKRRGIITGIIAALCTPSKAMAGIDVSGLRVEGARVESQQTADSSPTIDLAGLSYTPAAMMLQLAEQTASMEGMLRASASETKSLSRAQRIDAGSKGKGPGVVSRRDLLQSVDIMVSNSKVASLAPTAALTLGGIPRIVNGGTGDMRDDEYLAVADYYKAAREDLRLAFERLEPEKQAEAKTFVRQIRAKDEERLRSQM